MTSKPTERYTTQCPHELVNQGWCLARLTNPHGTIPGKPVCLHKHYAALNRGGCPQDTASDRIICLYKDECTNFTKEHRALFQHPADCRCRDYYDLDSISMGSGTSTCLTWP